MLFGSTPIPNGRESVIPATNDSVRKKHIQLKPVSELKTKTTAILHDEFLQKLVTDRIAVARVKEVVQARRSLEPLQEVHTVKRQIDQEKVIRKVALNSPALAGVLRLHASKDLFLHQRKAQVELDEVLGGICEEAPGGLVDCLFQSIVHAGLQAAGPLPCQLESEAVRFDLVDVPELEEPVRWIDNLSDQVLDVVMESRGAQAVMSSEVLL